MKTGGKEGSRKGKKEGKERGGKKRRGSTGEGHSPNYYLII